MYSAIDTYLSMLQRHPTADEMMAQILTENFEVGIRGDDMLQGIEGLREHLLEREEFFDERNEIKAMLSVGYSPHGDIEVTTRLDFFLRRWKPPAPTSDEFTGTAFHTWRIRSVGERLRIASQIVDGFANLNDNARRLIASPVLGEDVEE
ncbi:MULTISPECIES: hypothetical protein [Mycobacterium]|uniref:hypothetical protein n=1 Tax=Mycobacterium TaxID=1763 RepID=UPI001056D310|nr:MULTISPECIES: hypothetical protein [Mycobacterium]